jgi:hypothetical protein
VTKSYSADLKQALRELLLMSTERAQLETKIAKQKKRVAALYELVQTDEDGTGIGGLVEGITDACRVVLRAAEKPLTPAEVRDGVQSLGLPPQANLLASVHTTLKRMKDAGEVKEVTHSLESGGVGAAYRWADDGRTLMLSSLLGKRINPELLPEEIRGVVSGVDESNVRNHPLQKLRAKPRRNPAFYDDAKK